MFDLVFTVVDGKPLHESMSDRQLVLHLTKELHAMALDFTKLDAALERNTKAVTALLAYTASLHPDPAVEAAAQVKLDNTAADLDKASGAAEVAVPADPPATAPA